MIKQEDVEKILDATEIIDVVGAFVPLKKRGVNYLGQCPFHNEKTPSFTVSPTKGIFKCFGCGEAGNAVQFLMKHEHYTYVEALRFLANKYGIEIHETQLTEEEKKTKDKKESLYNITEFAQKYFSNLLFNDSEGIKIGLSYFKERDLTEATIKKWGLGYSKDSYSDFTQYAKKNGYPEEDLIDSGLTISKEENHVKYDRFRARVIFPIYNIGGRALGFTARSLSNEKTKAKYVNSPETDIYSKSKVLFGLHLAKNEIAKQDLCYLVEGNMDAIMLSQNNIENVVATSGTALTIEQIRLIRRYTKNVTILYDGDSAGIKAAFRAIDLFLENGLNVKIVLFPDGHDPDSYCRMLPQHEFKAYITEKAENFILFKTHILLEEAKDDPFKRANLIKDIINSISLIPDHIERAAYIQQCSSKLNMKEEILSNELTKRLRDNFFKLKKKEGENTEEEISQEIIPIEEEKREKQVIEKEFSDEAQERGIINLLLNYGDRNTTQEIDGEKESYLVAAYIIGDIVNDEIVFDNKDYNKILEIYKSSILDKGKLPNLNLITNHEDENIRKISTSLLINNYKISDLWQEKWGISVPNPDNQELIDRYVKECLLSLKINKLEKKIQKIKDEIKTQENEDDILILISKQNSLLKIKQIIAKELNRIIT